MESYQLEDIYQFALTIISIMETISWLQLPAGMLLLLCERGNMLLYLLATLSIALGLLPMLRMESGWLPEGIRIKN